MSLAAKGAIHCVRIFDVWQILALAVSQDRRCQGIGRALLEELLRIGKG